MLAAMAVLVGTGAVVMAQKVSTPEELDKAMKSNGQANQGMRKAVGSGAFADARTQLKMMRQSIAGTEAFMVLKKKDDGVKFAKESLAKIDALDKALGAAAPDAAAVAGALKELGGTCQACHMEFRDKDAGGQYIIKPGKID
jgi:cytochrome c556